MSLQSGENRAVGYGRIRKKEVVRNIQGKYNTPRITYRTGGRSPRTGCSRIHCRMLFPAIALLIIAASVYIPYAALLCFGYTVTCTAIVLDGTGLGKGIRAAWTYISKNKAKMVNPHLRLCRDAVCCSPWMERPHIPTRHPALLRRIL